jgi:hypothetical protein
MGVGVGVGGGGGVTGAGAYNEQKALVMNKRNKEQLKVYY